MGGSDFDKQVMAPAVDSLIYGMKSQGYRWQSSVGLTATQILYAQGKVGTGIDIAKIYRRLKEVNLENVKATVKYNVETAFDQLIYLDSAVAILEASIAQTQQHIDYVNGAVESGLASELDQIRAQLQLDQLKSELEKTKKNQILARNALLNTMGMDWEADVQFKGELRDPNSNLPYPDTAMANVKKRRKELVMLDQSEDMLQKNISIEEGGYKPTIVLVGGLKYSNNKNEIQQWDAPDWDKNINKYVGLNLTMNLFNGMKTKEAVAPAGTPEAPGGPGHPQLRLDRSLLQGGQVHPAGLPGRLHDAPHHKAQVHGSGLELEQRLQRPFAGHRRISIGQDYEQHQKVHHHPFCPNICPCRLQGQGRQG